MPYSVPPLRTIHIDRYVLPLREGGSVPGLVTADDGLKYVIKFRGAAQGPKVLIAELIGGELARALGLNMPELVFAQLDEAYGRIEHDEEIQSQLKASTGLNLGVSYLDGAITFDPAVTKINADDASKILWLDSLITNVDRTARNTNMLIWNKQLWLIDHGASLIFHYSWLYPPAEQALRPFPLIKNHVLLKAATRLAKADKTARAVLSADVVHNIVALIPDDWLADERFATIAQHRYAYETFLLTRIKNSAIFIKEAIHAREEAI